MAHYDTFRFQLAIAHPALGHALWEPEPGQHSPPVEVGDVGYIREGKFHRLFNALFTEDHPSHATYGVPEGHEPLRPSTANHIDQGTLSPNNFCSYGVKVTPGESEGFLASGPPTAGSVDVSFSCTKKHGAVLSLPVAARREDTSARGHFRKWMTRHIDSWFCFTQRHGLGIEMEDIVLVTGCHRTRSWTNIAFYEGQSDARISFGVNVTDINGTAVNWRSQHAQGAMLNHGPSGENLPENQCIFVRGFRVKRSFKMFPRVKGAVEPPPDPSGNNDEREIEVVPIASAPKHQDPLHVLLECIAKRAPYCDLVLVHDDDLERILRVGDRTSLETLQTAEMMSYLQRSELEVGVEVISDHLPSNDENLIKDTTFGMAAMLFEQLEDDPTFSGPPRSHASIGATKTDGIVQFNPLNLASIVVPRLETAEPDEPSRVTQVDQLAVSVHIPIAEYLSMGDMPGSIQKIDARITHYQRHLSVSFRLDPYRPKLILGMAVSLLKRHMLSNLREDLDKSLVHFTESILLPPSSWLEHRPLVLQALFLLSLGLIMRSSLSMQPQDAIDASKYLRLLRDQPQQAFGFPRHQVTTLLMDALAFQVELEAGNVMQNIGEMAVLCRELLTLDTSNVDTTPFVTLIVRAVLYKISLGVPDQPLDQLIESLRAARNHRSDLREARFALALCLGYRYCAAFVHDDYVEAASVLDEIITSSSPGNEDKLVAKTQEFAKLLEILRLTPQQTMEYSEATNSARAFLGSPSIQEPFHTTVVFSLEEAAKQRFRYFDSIEGFEAPAEHSPLSQAEPVFSFVEDKDDFSGSGQKMTFLVGLLLGIRYKDIAVIDEDIEKGRVILAVSASEGLDASFLSELFGKILFEAFKRTKKIGYLDESIRIRRQVRENPLPQFLASTTRRQLSLSLLTRLVTFPRHRAQDLDDALELVSQCVHDGHVSFPDRFQFACEWAYFARLTGHPSVSMAYETALSLMQDILHSAPTVQLQHTRLAMTDFAHGLPMDYASYQVDLGQLQDTIKTLERGRALLWSEMRRLRNSADQILQADPQLGHKFAAINRDLEELTQSITPSHKLSVDDGSSDDLRAAVPFGRLLLNHRRLLEERDKLISQIQALPAFDSFLTSPSFETLRSAASSGPVIIINHSRWRSDIIVLLHNTPPSLIPTPHDLYDRAITLKDKLLASREKYGFNSNDYEQTLSLVLAELYKLVGKPVIDRLRQLQVPEQSRVWWCPTSVFCSLPLHAMGPIPSDDGEKRYFLDLYICSYTTTLSALIQSRDRDFGSLPTKRPSLLLVAPANPSLPAESGEIQVVQSLDAEVTSLISEAATPAAVIDGFRHHQFIHIAGYGKLEPGKPFEAGFELHGGERLTLLEIVRLHFPAAEFAFLSASHTAELTEGSVADEGLHLVAAVQYCGFRSVVGTMWSMADVDGRDLAGYIYQKLFSSPGQHDGIPYSERSAAALQFAVKKMRRTRRITLERWVNFVHYGA